MASSRSIKISPSLLVLMLLPIAGYAASIAVPTATPEQICPVNANYCTCIFTGPFYTLRCISLDDVEDFKDVVTNSTDNAAILEVDSVEWDYLPLDVLGNSSLHTFIVANSSFAALANSSIAFVPAENLHHLSLENVTFRQTMQWKQFSSLRNLEVMFVYNTTVPDVVNSRFSQHLSKYLKSVSISESNISSVEIDGFKNLEKLEILRLTHGKLTTFSRNSLPKSSNLKHLRLDYNNIHSLPVGVFEDLPQLEIVSLSNNSLSTLPQDVFGHLWKTKMHVELRGNPLKCDCRMLWIVHSTEKPQDIIGKCAHPKRLFGKDIRDLSQEDLKC
ncbi:hypothetical protein JTE90_009435 [Oedothorax gibbosus]|uniref:Uncharacterized protein n=1 Tax=Oedothorax gibbosus TaxID=931172 RepID=A0AAV6VU78_9ARAC|nr:hypothetical protein JTE90_009435 [Oedothorax gibbosus]